MITVWRNSLEASRQRVRSSDVAAVVLGQRVRRSGREGTTTALGRRLSLPNPSPVDHVSLAGIDITYRYRYVRNDTVHTCGETSMQTERFEMRLDRATLERLDQWRASQPELPSRAEAVRRLVNAGLAVSSNDEVRPSLTEKLILSMLCDLTRSSGDKERIDPDFVEEAICGGHYWAINQKYSHISCGRPDSPELVREVVDILNMWVVIEHHYDQLGETDKARVTSEAELAGSDVRFVGFYANEESSHLSIARLLIERLENYPHFEKRQLNTRWPVVDWYRRMLRVYEPMRESLLGRSLLVSEIVSLLRERIHPENRQKV